LPRDEFNGLGCRTFLGERGVVVPSIVDCHKHDKSHNPNHPGVSHSGFDASHGHPRNLVSFMLNLHGSAFHEFHVGAEGQRKGSATSAHTDGFYLNTEVA
jgi:hypothetical protein